MHHTNTDTIYKHKDVYKHNCQKSRSCPKGNQRHLNATNLFSKPNQLSWTENTQRQSTNTKTNTNLQMLTQIQTQFTNVKTNTKTNTNANRGDLAQKVTRDIWMQAVPPWNQNSSVHQKTQIQTQLKTQIQTQPENTNTNTTRKHKYKHNWKHKYKLSWPENTHRKQIQNTKIQIQMIHW